MKLYQHFGYWWSSRGLVWLWFPRGCVNDTVYYRSWWLLALLWMAVYLKKTYIHVYRSFIIKFIYAVKDWTVKHVLQKYIYQTNSRLIKHALQRYHLTKSCIENCWAKKLNQHGLQTPIDKNVGIQFGLWKPNLTRSCKVMYWLLWKQSTERFKHLTRNCMLTCWFKNTSLLCCHMTI